MSADTIAKAAAPSTAAPAAEPPAAAPVKRWFASPRMLIALAVVAVLLIACGAASAAAYSAAQTLQHAKAAYAAAEAQLHAQTSSSFHAGNALELRQTEAATLQKTIAGILAGPAGAIDATAAAQLKTASDALGESILVPGAPDLKDVPAATPPTSTDALEHATKVANALIVERSASIKKTDDADTQLVAAMSDVRRAASSVAVASAKLAPAFLAASPLAGAAEQAAFTAAAAGLSGSDSVAALQTYGAAAAALQTSQSAGAAAAAAAAAAPGSHTGHHSTGGGSTGGSSSGGGGSGGGSTCYGNQENACVKTPAKFTTNSFYVPPAACNGSFYLSHNVGYGGTSTASQSSPFTKTQWTATVSGPTVTYYICG